MCRELIPVFPIGRVRDRHDLPMSCSAATVVTWEPLDRTAGFKPSFTVTFHVDATLAPDLVKPRLARVRVSVG
jgi:hypothetical protein